MRTGTTRTATLHGGSMDELSELHELADAALETVEALQAQVAALQMAVSQAQAERDAARRYALQMDVIHAFMAMIVSQVPGGEVTTLAPALAQVIERQVHISYQVDRERGTVRFWTLPFGELSEWADGVIAGQENAPGV